MLTANELNNKIQDWQDKDALKKMSKDELVEVTTFLVEGIRVHSVALEEACDAVLRMSKLLVICSKEVVDPMLGLILEQFTRISSQSLKKAVNDYLTGGIMKTCECEKMNPEDYIKKCRGDKDVSDAELLEGLKKIMGMDEEK